jgi:pimeloyl-ACP methyl ester carboxylesterase
MATASINGITISYRDEGTGKPLLLVHAFPLSSAMWERQVAALSPRNRVIAPDLRGFGASASGSGAASLDQHADDLAALLDHLKLDRVTVAGLSMGGYISFALLRRHRARVGELILADTRAGADGEEARQGREKNAKLAEEQGAGAIADQMLPKLLASSAPQALRDEVRRLIEANQPAGIAAALRAMAARPDSTPQLASIDVPTLIVVGSEDALTPPSESRAMHAAIAGSKLVEIPGAGHLANLEAPEAFNTAVDEFLSPFRALRFSGDDGGDDTLQAGGGLAGSW